MLAPTSFDGPATTDAALAALAAEVGLIDPEPEAKDAENFSQSTDSSQADTGLGSSMNTSQELMEFNDGAADLSLEENHDRAESMETAKECSPAANVEATEPASNNVVGLFGGARPGLKGGRVRLGLFGGGVKMPPRQFKWRKGLLGGGDGDSDSPVAADTDTASDTLNASFPVPASETENPPAETSAPERIEDNDELSANSAKAHDDDKPAKPDDDPEESDNEPTSAPTIVPIVDPFSPICKSFMPNLKFVQSEGRRDLKTDLKRDIKAQKDELDNGVRNGNGNNLIDVKKEETSDPLSTLASAALGRATPKIVAKQEVQFKTIYNRI